MRLAIIDGDFLLYTCLNGNKVLDSEGTPIKQDGKFVYGPKPLEQSCKEVDNFIRSIFNETKCSHYIGFIGGSSNRRKQINPEYKSKRPITKPDNFIELRRHIIDTWKFEYISDHEVDDYVRSYSRLPNSIIVSPDKDLLNLEGTSYNPKKNLWVTTSKQEAEYYFWKSMLVGDTADNVSGIRGIGEVAASKILENSLNYRESVLNIYLDKFGEYTGIQEFYKNYMSLYILDNLDIDETLIKQVDEYTNNLDII